MQLSRKPPSTPSHLPRGLLLPLWSTTSLMNLRKIFGCIFYKLSVFSINLSQHKLIFFNILWFGLNKYLYEGIHLLATLGHCFWIISYCLCRIMSFKLITIRCLRYQTSVAGNFNAKFLFIRNFWRGFPWIEDESTHFFSLFFIACFHICLYDHQFGKSLFFWQKAKMALFEDGISSLPTK